MKSIKTPSKLKHSQSAAGTALSSAGKASLISFSLSQSILSGKRNDHHHNNFDVRLENVDEMPRAQRLLVMALQIPQVDNLFKNIAYGRRLSACSRSFNQWKAYSDQKRREEEVLLMIKHMMTVTIQKVVRGKLSRNRVSKIRETMRQEQSIKYNKNLHLFQRIVRRYQWHLQLAILKTEQKSISLDCAARTIQRYFRGYLGRGEVILLERKKLLKYLRQWSHGLTNHLYHLTDLQDAEPLAVIHTAITFTTLPSKPIRNLPTLSQIKRYRAGLFILFWQVRSRYHRRKLELQQIVKERMLMRNEELLSLTREIVARVFADKIRLQKENLEIMQKREQLEMERRKNFQAAQFLSDLQNKKQQEFREEQEKKRREIKRKGLEEEFIKKQFQLQLSREKEMMTFEDQYAQLLRQRRKEDEKRLILLQQEHQKIVLFQEKLFYHQNRSETEKNNQNNIDKEVKLVSKQNQHLFLLYHDLVTKFRKIDLFFTDCLGAMFSESLGFHENFIDECKMAMQQYRNSWSAPQSSLSDYVKIEQPEGYNRHIDYFVKEMLKSCHFNFNAISRYLNSILKEATAMKSTQRRYRMTRRGTVDLLMRTNRSIGHASNTNTTNANSLSTTSSMGPYRLRYEMFDYLFRFLMRISATSTASPSPMSMFPSSGKRSQNISGNNLSKTMSKEDTFEHPWKSLLSFKHIISNCQWIVEQMDIPHFVDHSKTSLFASRDDHEGSHHDHDMNGFPTMASTNLPFAHTKSRGSSIASFDHPSDQMKNVQKERCHLAFAHACSRLQLIRYKEYLQYRYLTKKCFESQQALIYAIHQFESKHTTLEKLRKDKIQKEKLTLRSQRKELLDQAMVLEKELEELRKDLIYHASYLTDFMYFLVRMMLDIFFNASNQEGGMMGNKKTTENKQSTTATSPHVSPPELLHSGWYTSEREDGWGGIDTFVPSSGLCVYSTFRSSRQAKSRGNQEGIKSSYASDSDSSTGTSVSAKSYNQKDQKKRPNSQEKTGNNNHLSTTSTKKSNISQTDHVTMEGNKRANSSRRKKRRRKSRGVRKSRFGWDEFDVDSVFDRKFDIEKDDHDQYWKDLFDLAGSLPVQTSNSSSASVSSTGTTTANHHVRWQGITTLDLLRLPAPPIPMYQHDGRRHMMKVITSTTIKKKKTNIPKRFISSSKSKHASISVSVTSTSIFAANGSHDFHRPQSSSSRSTTPSPPKQRRNNPLLARLSNKFDKRRGMNVKKSTEENFKEQKFFNIPGENLFLEAAVTDYDFFHWAVEVDAWARDCNEFISFCENEWKRKQMQESFPSLVTETFACYQRYHYLSLDHYEYENPIEQMETAASATIAASLRGMPSPDGHTTTVKFWDLPKIPSHQYLQDEATNCAIMNKIALAKAVDLLEFKLLRSDVVVGILSDQLPPTLDGTTENPSESSPLLIPKRMIPIPGNVLESTIGRHSSSLYLRLLMENKIRQDEKLSFASFQGILHKTSSISDRFTIPTWDEVILKNDNELFAGFDRENICSLLNCIQKEREELKDTLKTIVKNGWLQIDSTPPPSTTQAPVMTATTASLDVRDNFASAKRHSLSVPHAKTWDSFEPNASQDNDDQSQTSLTSLVGSNSLRLAIPLSSSPTHGQLIAGSNLAGRKLEKSHHVDYNIDCSQSTADTWLFYFPRYMYPILRLGDFCGKESFFKRLQREKQRRSSKDSTASSTGTAGINVYSLIDEIDERCDSMARVALTYTTLRKKFKEELLQRIQYRLYQDEMFQQMKYEDARSHVMRFDEQEKQRLKELAAFQKKRQSSVFDVCLPWFNRSYAKIHVSQMTPMLREQIQFLKSQRKQRNQWTPFQQWRRIALQLEKIVRNFRQQCVPTTTNTNSQDGTALTRDQGGKEFLDIFQDPSFLSFCEEHRSKLCDEYGQQLNLNKFLQSLRKLTEKCQDPTSYFRRSSWITGQDVYLNEQGEHFNAAEMIFPKLSTMSTIYDNVNSALHLPLTMIEGNNNSLQHQNKLLMANGDHSNTVKSVVKKMMKLKNNNNANHIHIYTNKKESERDKNDEKSISFQRKMQNTKSSVSIANEKDEIKRRTNNKDFNPSSNHIKEVYIAGSLHKVFILLRVVEDEMVTDRGNLVLESFDRHDIHWIDQIHDLSPLVPSSLSNNNHTQSQPLQPQCATPMHGHPSSLHIDKLSLLRSGFQCFPVSDGDRRSYAQCLAVDHHFQLSLEKQMTAFNTQNTEKLRYMSFDNYQLIYGHEVDFNTTSLFKGSALPSLREIWRDLPVTVFRKRYLSVTKDHKVLMGIKKLQGLVRGVLYRKHQAISKERRLKR